ncbi:MAG: dTMP kinase [Magnetococcales bacterium]|nr:dTMP kinase [Magnetococcales bacterium]
MSGCFITLEGGEGAGKSTQISALKKRLEACNLEVVQTREPGGCPSAERIRSLLVTGQPGDLGQKAELLLMEAARAEHIRQTIKPALDRGAWVLCDRFTDSTVAYQGHGRGMDHGDIKWLNQWVTNGLEPDLTLVLDIEPDQGLKRTAQRTHNETRFEQEALLFHQRVRAGFQNLALAEPERFRVIDAHLPIGHVEKLIWQAVDNVRQRKKR